MLLDAEASATADARPRNPYFRVATLSIPAMLGFALLAAAGADLHGLATSSVDEYLRMIRAEANLLGGLWIFSGFRPHWARSVVLTITASTLFYDLLRTAMGCPPRAAFGLAYAPVWLLIGGEFAVTCMAVRWRFDPDGSCGLGRKWKTIAGVTAFVMGAMIDRSQIGRYPIVATANRPSAPSLGLDYLVYLPDGYYSSMTHWPLILVLHGSGKVGRDIQRIRDGGLPRELECGGHIPFIVVAPQCPKPGWDVKALEGLLEEIPSRWRIDADRVYLTGESMGGRGVWTLAAAHPEWFAAAAPICGWGEQAWAERLAKVSIRAFHGAEDHVIRPERSREMVEAVRRAGGDAELTIYPGVGHDSWTRTYKYSSLYEWFLAHRRRTP